MVDTTRVIILEVGTHTIPSIQLQKIGMGVTEAATQTALVTLDKRVRHSCPWQIEDTNHLGIVPDFPFP